MTCTNGTNCDSPVSREELLGQASPICFFFLLGCTCTRIPRLGHKQRCCKQTPRTNYGICTSKDLILRRLGSALGTSQPNAPSWRIKKSPSGRNRRPQALGSGSTPAGSAQPPGAGTRLGLSLSKRGSQPPQPPPSRWEQRGRRRARRARRWAGSRRRDAAGKDAACASRLSGTDFGN